MKHKLINRFLLLAMVVLIAFGLAGCDLFEQVKPRVYQKDGFEVGVIGTDKEAKLMVEDFSEDEVKINEVKERLKNKKYNPLGDMFIFNLYLEKDGKRYETENGAGISITFPIKEVLGKTYIIYHLEADGSIHSPELGTDPGSKRLRVIVDSLDLFVIVEEEIRTEFEFKIVIDEVSYGKVYELDKDGNRLGELKSKMMKSGEKVIFEAVPNEGVTFLGWYRIDETITSHIKKTRLIEKSPRLTWTMANSDEVICASFDIVMENDENN